MPQIFRKLINLGFGGRENIGAPRLRLLYRRFRAAIRVGMLLAANAPSVARNDRAFDAPIVVRVCLRNCSRVQMELIWTSWHLFHTISVEGENFGS